jgi:hypothetical protein
MLRTLILTSVLFSFPYPAAALACVDLSGRFIAEEGNRLAMVEAVFAQTGCEKLHVEVKYLDAASSEDIEFNGMLKKTANDGFQYWTAIKTEAGFVTVESEIQAAQGRHRFRMRDWSLDAEANLVLKSNYSENENAVSRKRVHFKRVR